jgi:hypothetical protein
MGVIQYIPRKKLVIDKRSEDGGYYEAICDECGNMFYPLRSTAKYCSRSCQVMNYRKNLKPKKTKEIKKESFKPDYLFNGLTNLFWDMKGFIKHGDNGILKKELRSLKHGEIYNYSTFAIKRISAYKYAIKISK